MFPMNPWPEPPDRPAPGCKPAPVYNPRMSLAGASRLAPRTLVDVIRDEISPPVWREYGLSKKNERRLIAAWILATPVDELADHILNGVDLDKPPPELLRKPPQSKLNRLLESAAAGPIPAATLQVSGTVVR